MTDDGDREDWLVEPSSAGDDRDTGADGDDSASVRSFENRLSSSQPQDAVAGAEGRDSSESDRGGRMWRPSNVPWVVWFVMAIGLVFLITGIGIGFSTWRFLQIAEPADGVVVELVEQRRRDDGEVRITYAPRVEFTSAEGQAATFVSNTSARPANYEVGETVDVLFDPDNIDRARIDSRVGLWVLPIVFIVVGLVVLPIAVVLARRLG